MTEIPGGITPEVHTATFVSNNTGKAEFRLAEDQMQRIMRSILASGRLNNWPAFRVDGRDVTDPWEIAGYAMHIGGYGAKPNPEPEPIPAIPDNGVPPVDPPETYQQAYENYYRLWLAVVKDRTFLEKERNINKDRISELEQEVEFIKSAEDTLKVQIECLKSNLDAANDRAHMAEGRAYSLMCDYNRCKKEAELEVERLKAQVPKERYSVWIEMNPKTMRWNAFPCARDGVMFDSTATKGETLQKCRDYGFEVVE